MAEALGWGALAASSLLLGAILSFARGWSKRRIGGVLAFGAGALISAVSFELVEEGNLLGGLGWTGLGLGLGAITYYLADGAIAARFSAGRGRPGRRSGTGSGTALALGAFLDGVPEQLVLGISLAEGGGVGVGLLVAIFVSNLPEAIGSATDMSRAGARRDRILRLWTTVTVICVLSTLVGFAIADLASGEARSTINGFAAGALIVMLVDSMIPTARADAGRPAGLLTALGFAVATGLSSLG